MIKEVSDCVDCGKPCIRNACRYYKTNVYYCDGCGLQIDCAVYEKDGHHLCENCMIENVKENADSIFEEYEDEILECLGFVKER